MTKTRERYMEAQQSLAAMENSTTLTQFNGALRHFLTDSISVVSVAQSEAAAAGERHCVRSAIDALMDEDLFEFFNTLRNKVLKEAKPRQTRTYGVIAPAGTIRLGVGTSSSVTIRGQSVDTVDAPRTRQVKGRRRTARGTIKTRRAVDLRFVDGNHKGEYVVDLCIEDMKLLDRFVRDVEKCLARAQSPRV